MIEEQKARLEQELRFLRESLEADIITKEEFVKGEERIKNKLKKLEGEEEVTIKEAKEEEIKEIQTEEKKEEIEAEEKKDEKREKEEEQKVEEEEIKEEIKIEEKKGEVEEEKKGIEEKEEEKTAEEAKEKIKAEKPVKEKEEKVEEKKKKPRRLLKWIRFIVVLILLYFLFRGCFGGDESPVEIVVPDCMSDEDCYEPGKIGICVNPNTTDAKCDFKEDIKVKLIVLNDKECKNCDTGRMIQVIKQLFPGVEYEELEYNSAEGLGLLNMLGIEALPAYIFDENIADAYNFDKFKRALEKKGDRYVITPEASGANYYFKREEIKNKLELFVIDDSDVSSRAEENVEDVLQLFGDKVHFEKKLVTEAEKEVLAEKLGITSFPAFLVNNQLKFGGVVSPESIKEKFCELNKLEECKKELSEDIK